MKTLLFVPLTAGWLVAQTFTYFPQVAKAPENARSIATDATGVYVAGEVRRSYAVADEPHAFLRKFDSQGKEIWTRQFDTATAETAITTSATGVYVGGYSAAAVTPTVHEAFLRRHDSDGNEMWTRQFAAQSNTRLSALIADDAGIYAVAWSEAQNDDYPNGSASWTLRRFDAGGQELWTVPVSGPPTLLHADATGLYVIDSGDPVYPKPSPSLQKYSRSGIRISAKALVTGTGVMFAAHSEGFYSTAVSYTQAGQIAQRFFQSFDYDGNLLWSRAFSGEVGEYHSSAMAADDGGGFYFASSMLGTLEGQCRAGNLDLQVSRFDSQGNRIWQRQLGTDQNDLVGAIAVMPDRLILFGSVVVALDKDIHTVAPGPRIHNECVLNAANYAGGSLAPGEIVTVLGASLGPPEAAEARVSGRSRLPQVLGSTRVLFNGVPGALLYVSDRQTTAIVPYGIAADAWVDVQVEYAGALSNTVRLPVRTVRLGVFSLDGSGQGAAAAFNDDGSPNSPSNPAHAGTVVTFYATGAALPGQPSERDVVSLPLSPIHAGLQVFLSGPSPEEELAALEEQPSWAWPEVLPMITPLYVGGVAGSVSGLIQVQFRLPESASAGTWRLQFSALGDPIREPVASEPAGTFVSSQATIVVARP